jgi:transcriptional antiterminator RfaH
MLAEMHYPNVCAPPLRFHLQRQKFSTIWPGSREHRTRSRASSTGGYSTPASGIGRRKLRRPSRNSSNEVSSRKSNLRTAKYFTTSLVFISPLFINGHVMTTSDEIQWFAIQARLGAEAVAESNLRALPIETLLPLVRRPVHHATRASRMVLRPLFPGYFFARFCAAVLLRAVKYSRGVLRVVGGSEQPWPVDEAIITDIRQRIGPEGCVDLREPPFRVGDPVRITGGPLAGWSGIFGSELSDAERVVILIETLQQGRVVVRRDSLELSEAA